MGRANQGKRVFLNRLQMETLDNAIYRYAAEQHPVGPRGIYYGLKAMHVYGAEDYQRIIRRTVLMRENWALQMTRGAGSDDKASMPMTWISGNRAWFDNDGYEGLEDLQYIEDAARVFQLSPWTTEPVKLLMYTESKSLEDIIQPVCDEYHVDLRTAGGQSSVAEAWTGARAIADSGKDHAIIGYVGDLGHYGEQIEEELERKLRHYAWCLGWDGRIDFTRIGLTQEQVETHDLPVLPPKKEWRLPYDADGEAMPPNYMRHYVGLWLDQFITAEDLHENNAEQDRSRAAIRGALEDAESYR